MHCTSKAESRNSIKPTSTSRRGHYGLSSLRPSFLPTRPRITSSVTHLALLGLQWGWDMGFPQDFTKLTLHVQAPSLTHIYLNSECRASHSPPIPSFKSWMNTYMWYGDMTKNQFLKKNDFQFPLSGTSIYWYLIYLPRLPQRKEGMSYLSKK